MIKNMPIGSRGAQYYGKALAFLSCRENHEKLANDLYSQAYIRKEPFAKTECGKCGAYITVSIRGVEWETKIFSRGLGKERG